MLWGRYRHRPDARIATGGSAMRKRRRGHGPSRREVVAGAAAMLALTDRIGAQTMASTQPQGLSERIAAFATGFELGKAPPRAIETARTAFVDTTGVALAGSTEK